MSSIRPYTTLPGVSDARRADFLKTVLAAVAVTVVLSLIPYVSFLTYPIRLLVTFLHEGGHALAAILTGGSLDQMRIFADGSGVTHTRGGLGFVISSAGYVGATLYGALLIAGLRRGVRPGMLLLITGALVGLMTLTTRNVFGFAWGVALTALLVGAGVKLPARQASWAAAFIGVQCILNALFDLRTLFGLSLGTGAQTDAMNMQNATLIPAVVWATLWIATSLVILFSVLIRPEMRAAAAAQRRLR